MKKNTIILLLLMSSLLSYKNTYASHAAEGLGNLIEGIFLTLFGLFSIGSILSFIFSIVYYKKQKKSYKQASAVLISIFDSLLLIMFLIWLFFASLGGETNYYTNTVSYSGLYEALAYFILFLSLLVIKIVLLVKKPKVQ